MVDAAHAKTDKDIKTLERKIHSVFSQAEKEIEAKTKSFNERFGVKYNIHLQELKDEKITESQFRSWANGQVFQSRQWEAKRDQMIKIMHNANETATQIINATTPNVFAYNANFLSYSMEHDAATNFGFGLFDNATVTRLIKDDPQLLPKWKVDEKKDYIWNEKKVNNAVTQGIIQGEPLDAITKRLSKGLAAQNENTMKTFARTAMTGAQNAGRLESMKQGEKLGLQIYKEWMATLDSHTRDSHADIDGESVPTDSKFSNGLSYPGEAGGDPAEVYNCRCTMVADVKKYPALYSRRDNMTGLPVNKLSRDTVDNLTYKDWKMTKGIVNTAKMIDEKDKVAKTLQEVVGMGSGHLEGLDFKYKGFDSAFRKVVGDVKDEAKKAGVNLSELSKQEIFDWRTRCADKTADALRFTNISSVENFVSDYNTITSELQKRGFETIRVKNTLKDTNVPYRGVNTLVRTPSGYVIEMQYHTPQSIDIKERINHKIYEEQRTLSRSDPRWDELSNKMVQNMNSIVAPKGIETIKIVDYDTNQTKNVSPFGNYW